MEKKTMTTARAPKGDKTWKNVTIGGASAILMGSGLIYAMDTQAEDGQDVSTTGDNHAAHAAHVPHATSGGDNLSFSDAFAAARAELGPGGVFEWHGNVYTTYTAEEWKAMPETEQDNFTAQVPVEEPIIDIPENLISIEPEDVLDPLGVEVGQETGIDDGDEVEIEVDSNDDDDVQVVGYTDPDGNDIIEAGSEDPENIEPAVEIEDDALVIIDEEPVEEAPGADDNDYVASVENPETAPDMPDYMNDALVEV